MSRVVRLLRKPVTTARLQVVCNASHHGALRVGTIRDRQILARWTRGANLVCSLSKRVNELASAVLQFLGIVQKLCISRPQRLRFENPQESNCGGVVIKDERTQRLFRRIGARPA